MLQIVYLLKTRSLISMVFKNQREDKRINCFFLNLIFDYLQNIKLKFDI